MKQNYTKFKGLRGLAMLAFLTLVGIPASFAQTTYTFTNAAAAGVTGPTQVQVDAAYAATNLAGNVASVGQGMQEWTVPLTGNYSISAAGASGGFTPNAIGGQGREITVDVLLTAGDIIRITVGQEGGVAEFTTGYCGGGGGGTFIINQTTGNPILITGGGGGAGEGNGTSYQAILNGVDASDYNVEDGTDGTGYAGSWSTDGIGGVAGAGGQTGQGGSGGGGYLTDGQLGTYGGNIGNSYASGALGGTNRDICGSGFTLDVPGGFGGGAGAGVCTNYEANGGGAGGYSGGGGSNSRVGSGGGGGNFYTGTYVSSSLNIGHGVAVFTQLCVDSAPSAFTADVCDTYTVPSGDETYVVSGVYNDTIPNATGCDSVMTITVNVSSLDLNTTTADFTITADHATGTYQWINCSDNSPIAGATNQSFTADANGDYAVIITDGPCSDTSACTTIAGVSINESNDLDVNVYPNPTNGQVYISSATNVTISIYSIDGKLVINNLQVTESNQMIDLGNIEKGIYFIEVSTETTKETIRLVVE
jgi:hypothetical protein